MKTLLLITFASFGISNFSHGQTVVYDIQASSLVGLELTSGDICTAPFTVEEAKQISAGNAWGGSWTSTNAGPATSILVELQFTICDSLLSYPTTLNGTSSNMIDVGFPYNCEQGFLLSWDIDPASYNAMGMNTFLVDFAQSGIINQVDNLPYPGDPYLRVTVEYDPSSAALDELNANSIELVKIVDLTGRETVFAPNTQLIYIYSDGSVERVYEIEQ